MKRLVVILAGLVLVASGCGDASRGDATDPTIESTAEVTPDTAAIDDTSEGDTPAATSLVVSPGSIGDADVGMTKQEAAGTGLFDVDVDTGDDGCEAVVDLRWRDNPKDTLDVLTDADGAIASMGVRAGGPETAEGVGVGSTFAEVSATYGDQLTGPVEAGFNQSGVLLRDGDAYLGFLFDTTVGRLSTNPDQPVSFMEVTLGEQPSLIRDGC